MADEIPISGLPAAVTPALADLVPVVNSGITKKETWTQVKALFNDIGTLSSDSGSATGTTVTIAGAGSVSTSAIGSTVTITGLAAEASLSPYIVGATASDYTTIQAAINAAVADGSSASNQKNIYIKPGTYTEDLTISDGINLIGFGGYAQLSELPAKVVGINTISGQCNISNLAFDGTGQNYNFSGPGAAVTVTIDFVNCYFTGATNAAFNGGTGAGASISLHAKTCLFDGIILQPTEDNISATVVLSNCDHLSGGNPLFKFSDVVTGPVLLTALLNNVGSNATVLIDDSTSVCGQAYVTMNRSVLPLTMTVPATCTITIIAQGSTIAAAAIDGGDSNSSINITGCNFISLPVISTYVGKGVIYGNNSQVAQVPTTAGKGLEKYYATTANQFLGSEKISSQACVQTVDATPVTLFSVSVAEGESMTLNGTIIGSSADHSDSIGGSFIATVRRAAAGNITLVGTADYAINTTSTADFSLAVDTVAQVLNLNITGIAADYNWSAFYEYHKVLSEV